MSNEEIVEEFERRFCTPFILGSIPKEPRLALINDMKSFLRKNLTQ